LDLSTEKETIKMKFDEAEKEILDFKVEIRNHEKIINEVIKLCIMNNFFFEFNFKNLI